jgi:TonB family protein
MLKRFLALAFLVVACAADLPGQSIFLLKTDDDHFRAVCSVRGMTPEVEIEGKIKQIPNPKNVMLKAAPSFADGFVKFDNFRLTDYLDGNGDQDDHYFNIKATLVADRTLRNCYAVIVFKRDEQSSPPPITVEVQDLEAGKYGYISMRIQQDPGSELQDKNYTVHFFSDAGEHVTSLMPADKQIEFNQFTDAEVLKRTESRPLAPLLMIQPQRPADLPAGLAGSAVIHCRVSPMGRILEASIVKATNSEFGQSGLDAVQQWIFMPRIKNHEYVETQVNVPVIFNAPSTEPAAAK